MIELVRKTHKDQDVLLIRFPFDDALKSRIREHYGSRWSQTNRSWYIPFSKFSLDEFAFLFPDVDISAYLVNFEEVSELVEVKKQKTDQSNVRILYSYKKIRIWSVMNDDDILFFKSFHYSRWNPGEKCWVIPNYDDNLTMLRLYFGIRLTSIEEVPEEVVSSSVEFEPLIIPPEILPYIKKLADWMEHKRYSSSSVKSYVEAARTFLAYTYPKPVEELDNNDMIYFVNTYIIPRELSYAFQNHVINAVKILFREVIKSNIDIEKLERPRREHKLPNVLSKDEVKLILDSTINLKHKSMLSLIYACGLRRGELLSIKPRDVDSNRKLLILRNAKGKKDRVVPLSDKIIELLREYYKKYRPMVWLFEGIVKSEQYTASSLQKVLKLSLETAKIRKPVTLHWLRHSYATHLLEAGVDLRYIQEILGHKSSRTTEIYTHVSTKNLQNIKSPFDDL